ncbi:hypothetical protein TNIN_445621 [Trichonephila inaurata madagascariensis]|uniref:Uncharacterized protein n=1 Tax=Trichonephila inaurata madagascariensis TaxID=2747483 RepID=A0A8X6WZ98_9ARAC|nr:hypothetical protein TNIN_445621 [Trichonephila inaurata madagascariensis]
MSIHFENPTPLIHADNQRYGRHRTTISQYIDGTDDVAFSSVSLSGILFKVRTLQGSNPYSGGILWSLRLVLISDAYRYPMPPPKCHVEINKAMLPNTRFIFVVVSYTGSTTTEDPSSCSTVISTWWRVLE